MKEICWGIIGAGNIAKCFVAALPLAPGNRLVAVASQTEGKAKAFIEDMALTNVEALDCYEALLAREDIDVVYVATVNTEHCANTLLALNYGKAVLCEKPFALNEKEARLMIEKAREKGLFLMEAMWTRLNPINSQVRSLIKSGRIGEVKRIEASFGYFGGEDKAGRHLNRDLGGGSLLDVGIYPLSYSAFLLGLVPHYEYSCAVLDEFTGVDRQFEGLATAASDCLIASAASVVCQLANDARIFGSKAFIRVPCFFNPKTASIMDYGKDHQATAHTIETLANEEGGNGYQYEIMAVADCLRQGKTESDVMPLEESLALMAEMDRMRASWGLSYPSEEKVKR